MKNRILSQKHLDRFRINLLREEKSAATVEKYLRDTGLFMDYSLGKSITKENTIAFKQFLLEKGYAIRSINSMLTSVNKLFDFLGWIECKVKNLRCQRQIYCAEERKLSKTEYIRLLQASKYQTQLNLVLQTICSTGIRVSELRFFTVEAVSSGEVIVNCKNKTRTIMIPGKLKKLLLNYAKEKRIKSGAVFISKNGKPLNRSNIWAKMKRLSVIANVASSKVFPHNLRKLFARTFYAAEKDIAKLADILGHSSIDTTRIYIMTDGNEHRKKIDRLGLVMLR